MKVKRAMHTGAQWMEPGTALSTIPIGENDRLVGMVTDRDIVSRGLAAGLDLNRATARGVVSKGIFYCRDTEEVAEAARTMEEKKVRRLPVINQDKRLVGILSVGDISLTGERALCGEIVQAVAAHAA
jgi:CBS domain-containing protein